MLPHIAGNLLPVATGIRMEDIRQSAPAAVPGEHGLFGLGRLAAFVLNEPQRPDGRDVGDGLFLKPALPDPVRFNYPEVARRGRGRRFRLDVAGLDFSGLDFPDEGGDGGGRSSLCGSAHSCNASSHAA